MTALELEIMEVLWANGTAPVAVVQAALDHHLAYNTVQTMLNVLLNKSRVRRFQIGKAFHYEPVITRQSVVRSAVEEILGSIFGGSAEKLVLSLVDAEHIDPEQLECLAKRINQNQMSDDMEMGD